MKKTIFATLLLGMKFAANANVTKLLKKDNVTDAELAIAVKTTKQYKDNKELQSEVAKVIASAGETVVKPVKEAAPAPTRRSGESRHW